MWDEGGAGEWPHPGRVVALPLCPPGLGGRVAGDPGVACPPLVTSPAPSPAFPPLSRTAFLFLFCRLVLFAHELDFDAMRWHWDDFARHARESGIFLGKVNMDENPGLRLRFALGMNSKVLLFRHRKMYEWDGTIHTLDRIFSWAKEGYASYEAKEVPTPLTIVERISLTIRKELAKKNSHATMYVAVAVAVVLMYFHQKKIVAAKRNETKTMPRVAARPARPHVE